MDISLAVWKGGNERWTREENNALPILPFHACLQPTWKTRRKFVKRIERRRQREERSSTIEYWPILDEDLRIGPGGSNKYEDQGWARWNFVLETCASNFASLVASVVKNCLCWNLTWFNKPSRTASVTLNHPHFVIQSAEPTDTLLVFGHSFSGN